MKQLGSTLAQNLCEASEIFTTCIKIMFLAWDNWFFLKTIIFFQKQVQDPWKGLFGTHSSKLIHSYTAPGKFLENWIKQYRLGHIRQVAIWVFPIITSWGTDSSNISLVVLDKLLYYSRNLFFEALIMSKHDSVCRQK